MDERGKAIRVGLPPRNGVRAARAGVDWRLGPAWTRGRGSRCPLRVSPGR